MFAIIVFFILVIALFVGIPLGAGVAEARGGWRGVLAGFVIMAAPGAAMVAGHSAGLW